MHTDTFDKAAARERHDAIIKEVQWIRDAINKDVIDYYHDDYPESEEEMRRQREDMRKYLYIADERIHDLLNGKLR